MQSHRPSPSSRGFIRRNLVAVLGVGVAAGVGLAWLAFGYFGIHTAFFDREVTEAGPVFTSGVPADEGPDTAEPSPVDDAAEPVAADGEAPTPAAEPSGDGEVMTLASGTFSGLGRYSGRGDALVLGDGGEQRFLRFEDFETSNGPDLNVYLTVGGDVDAGYVDLGELKGNIGSQNYEIPAGVDLGEFDTVVIWCVRFGVGFAEAALS